LEFHPDNVSIQKDATIKMRLGFIDLPLGTEILRLGPRPIPRLQPIHQLEFAGLGLGIVLHPMKHTWLVRGVENLEVCTLRLCGNEFVHRLQGCQECFAVLWEDVHSDVQGYSVALVRHGWIG